MRTAHSWCSARSSGATCATIRLSKKGDAPTSLILVLAGKLKLTCQSPDDNERVIDILTTGQTYGEAGVSLAAPHPVFVTALARTHASHIELRRYGNWPYGSRSSACA